MTWERSRGLAAAALLALLVLPAASAHIQGARPVLQSGERNRLIGLGFDELAIDADLSLEGDPLRQLIVHRLDASTGEFSMSHRTDASRDEDEFRASWRFTRLIEYQDQNLDGRYQRAGDTALRAWRFEHYRWNRTDIQQAKVADVTANDVIWNGTLTGGPKLRFEAVIAGRPFADEGANVRPQDIALYIELTDMPNRALGSLYALEIGVVTQSAAHLSLFEAENTTTAIFADVPMRRALLVWGGEALLDGAEQRIDATIEDELVTDAGNRTATLTLHLPTVDESMRFVMVSGIEYVSKDQRGSPAGVVPVLAAALVAHFALRARRRA